MKKKLDMVRYYGQLHQHAVQPRPRDSTEISVVYQDNLNTVRVSTLYLNMFLHGASDLV